MATMTESEMRERTMRAAKALICRKGYAVAAESWECPAGTVDLVAACEGELVFVDVAARLWPDEGMPEEPLGARFRSRMERVAGCFLAQYDGPCAHVRFDVVGVLVLPGDRGPCAPHGQRLRPRLSRNGEAPREVGASFFERPTQTF